MKKSLSIFRAHNNEMSISLSGLAKCKEIYFVGENGSGKSSLLQLLKSKCSDSIFLTANAKLHHYSLIDIIANLPANILSESSGLFNCTVSDSKELLLDFGGIKQFDYLGVSKGYQYMARVFLCIADAVVHNNTKSVFIDDFASNLSPNNVYKLIEFLRKVFPDTQFVFTTNNPIAIMGASRDAIIYRLYREEDNKITTEEPFLVADMSHLMANSIVTCPLFSMESARMRVYDDLQDEDLDTSTSYLHSRLRKAIADEVAEIRKSRGTPFISTQRLDEIIKNALEKYKSE